MAAGLPSVLAADSYLFPRHEVSAEVPADFDLAEGATGPGAVAFKSHRDSGRITIFGVPANSSLDAQYKSLIGFYENDGARITYKVLKKDWFVL